MPENKQSGGPGGFTSGTNKGNPQKPPKGGSVSKNKANKSSLEKKKPFSKKTGKR